MEIYQKIKSSKQRKFVINCSRRLGKSYLLCVIAMETAMQRPGAQVRFAAATAKALRKIIIPIFRQIISDCPPEIAPEFKSMDSLFQFENGAQIHLAGADKGNADNLRGTAADLCIVDEAGFISELDYLVGDVLAPQLLYAKDGKIIIASTPPESPAHDFVRYLIESEINGACAQKTIFDNPFLTKKDIDIIADECGGYDTTRFKREYLAQVVTEETYAVIPEFQDAEKDIVQEVPRPPMFHFYTVGDLGFKDATAFAIGYYNFEKAKIVIEDEIVLHAPTSRTIAEAIKEKEKALYGVIPVYQRFADGDLITLGDISVEHGVTIGAVKKDVLEAQVNTLRMDVIKRNLIIHPRCKTIINHLKYGIWNKARTGFDRSGEFFHFDALAALIYFVRHVNRHVSPYPKFYNVSLATHHIPPEMMQNTAGEWGKIRGG